MYKNKVPHILPSRYREDGKLIDYIVNIKMVGQGWPEYACPYRYMDIQKAAANNTNLKEIAL